MAMVAEVAEVSERADAAGEDGIPAGGEWLCIAPWGRRLAVSSLRSPLLPQKSRRGRCSRSTVGCYC